MASTINGDGAPVGSSWASCLVVVGSYEPVAPAVRRAVDEAAAELQRSPALGDFIELRFVSAGLRPAQDGDRSEAVARLVDQTCRPSRDAPENYLETVVVDDSGMEAAALASACRHEFNDQGVPATVAAIAVTSAGEDEGAVTVIGPEPGVEQRVTGALVARCTELMNQHGAAIGDRVMSAEALRALTAPTQPTTLLALSAGLPTAIAVQPEGDVAAPPVRPPTPQRARWRSRLRWPAG